MFAPITISRFLFIYQGKQETNALPVFQSFIRRAQVFLQCTVASHITRCDKACSRALHNYQADLDIYANFSFSMTGSNGLKIKDVCVRQHIMPDGHNECSPLHCNGAVIYRGTTRRPALTQSDSEMQTKRRFQCCFPFKTSSRICVRKQYPTLDAQSSYYAQESAALYVIWLSAPSWTSLALRYKVAATFAVRACLCSCLHAL